MYKLGKRSLQNIDGCSPYIQIIVKRAIQITEIDFGILNTGGLRTAEMQNEIYKQGHSKCDGFKIKSYHQTGNAVDLIPYLDGKYTWNNKLAFIMIINAWNKAEEELKQKGVIPTTIYFHHGIFWNWDDLNKDGELDINDRLGWDCAHHQQSSKPQKI